MTSGSVMVYDGQESTFLANKVETALNCTATELFQSEQMKSTEHKKPAERWRVTRRCYRALTPDFISRPTTQSWSLSNDFDHRSPARY